MRRITSLFLAFALSITALSAAASNVTITDNSVVHAAYGTIDDSGDPSRPGAYMYCYLYGATMYCGAYDGVGTYAGCSTTDQKYKRLFPAIRKNTGLQFFWNTSTGACERLDVWNGTRNTMNLPPVPGSFKQPSPVYVDAANRYAAGTVAPLAGSPSVGIGCTEQSFGSIYCRAQDSAGNFNWCSITRDSASQSLADQMLAAAAINESSYVYFAWDQDKSGKIHTCNFIYTVNASYQLP